MRKLLLLLLVAAAIIWMYRNPEDLRSKTTFACSKVADFFASLAGEHATTPSSAPQTQLQPKEVAQLAEGMFCLTKPLWVSAGGNNWMLPAGTLVRKKGDGGNGKVLVTDETGSGVIDTALLTRDPGVIALIEAANKATTASAGPQPQVASAAPVAPTEAGPVIISAEEQASHFEERVIPGVSASGSSLATNFDPARPPGESVETAERENSRLQAIDAELDSLHAQMAADDLRDARALKQGRLPSDSASQSSLQSKIWALEMEKRRISASQR